MSNYKLTVYRGQVYAVREEDLPNVFSSLFEKQDEFREFDEKKYQAALSEAIEKKGVRVVNWEQMILDSNFPISTYTVASWQEGSLYEVPPNYQIVIEDKYPLTIKGPEGVYRKGTPRKVARIAPVANQEPKRNPKLEAIRERTPQEVKDRVGEMMKQMKQEPDPVGQ